MVGKCLNAPREKAQLVPAPGCPESGRWAAGQGEAPSNATASWMGSKNRTDGNDCKGNLPLWRLLQGVSFTVISVCPVFSRILNNLELIWKTRFLFLQLGPAILSPLIGVFYCSRFSCSPARWLRPSALEPGGQSIRRAGVPVRLLIPSSKK